MRQSNLYIILYTAALTVISAVLLTLTSQSLKPRQQENIKLEQKKNILSTVVTLDKTSDVNAIYNNRVRSYVVDYEGEVVENVNAESVVVAEEYKKPKEERLFPVYEIVSEGNKDQVEFYVLPVFGYGLWNNIWGYVSLKSDLNSINGVSFDHAGETPGLGARIATEDIQARYVGKSIFDGNELVSVNMQKGEGLDYSDAPHKVDGMSGATITAKGVNDMLFNYLVGYENFIKSKRKNI